MNAKILDRESLAGKISELKSSGKRIVFTNGCFDLLHIGHVRCLQEAKGMGDALVVALNSDASVRMLKGKKRPIVEESARAEMLAALECVDFVTVFSEKRVTSLIEAVKPDVYVKAGDYSIDTLNKEEKAKLEEIGAEIRFAEAVKGVSTSDLIKRIKEAE